MRWRRSMTCGRFAAWLDAGMPRNAAAVAQEHAAGCAACARLAVAARELEALLEAPPPAAPATFTAAVMARLPATRPQTSLLPANPLPWWVRIVADPACVLALVAGALSLLGIGRRDAIEAGLASMRSVLVNTLWAHAPKLLDADTWSAVALSLGPALVLASIELFRWSVRQVHVVALTVRRG